MKHLLRHSWLLQIGAGALVISALLIGGRPSDPTSLEGTASFLPVRATSVEMQRAARDGEEIYEDRCATCHQLDGAGVKGVFPPLAGARWVTGDKGRLIRIILHGMRGEVEVKGSTYNSAMPAWGNVLSDQEVAEVATYVRSHWSNHASEVSTNEVARVRAATSARSGLWTAAELQEPEHTGIPEVQEGVAEATEEEPGPAHPYAVELPALYRTFMPESSPASIAVGLPGGESYCFDAAVGYVRYAWHGGFVDNADQWDGNGNAFTDVVGEVYFRNTEGVPLRIGTPEAVPDVAFKGYRLVDGGYPEFFYLVDGVEVRELITPEPDGRGLVRRFELGPVENPVWFAAGEEGSGVTFEASAGTWDGARLKLTSDQARRFTITMLRTGNSQP